MSTLFGLGLFSAFAALVADKIYASLVDSTSAAANAGRYAVFTGAWTTVTTAGGMRHMRSSINRFRRQSKTAQKFIERTKDD